MTRHFQEEITALKKWCNKWKIDLNAETTQAIVLAKRLKLKIEGVRLKDTDIEWRNDSIVHWGQDGHKAAKNRRKYRNPEQNCTP